MEWIYKNNEDNSCRYILGEPGNRTLCCIGVKPSTAEPNNLDNTLLNVRKIATKNGYDGWIMINIYPQKATDPSELHEEILELIHSQNLKYIEEYFSVNMPVAVWASWGTLIKKRKYLRDCLKDITNIISAYKINWLTFGKPTKISDFLT
jgi:hypothetical protein